MFYFLLCTDEEADTADVPMNDGLGMGIFKLFKIIVNFKIENLHKSELFLQNLFSYSHSTNVL